MTIARFYKKSRVILSVGLFFKELIHYLIATLCISMNKISGVYGLRCKITNQWYIGVSINIIKRWHTGYELLQCKKQFKIYRAIFKYGYQNFEKTILETCDKSDFKSKETLWITKYDAVHNGYNLAPGGEGGFRPIGIPYSEETKRKISLANTGHRHSEETKALFSKMRKGKSKPNGFGKKITEALTGVPLTEERKQNISFSKKGISIWSEKDKENMSKNRTGRLHPRWKPLPDDSQNFIRLHYLTKSENWIRIHLPEAISQKKLNRCIHNLKETPLMEEIVDFL